jgi:hypothetical protein
VSERERALVVKGGNWPDWCAGGDFAKVDKLIRDVDATHPRDTAGPPSEAVPTKAAQEWVERYGQECARVAEFRALGRWSPDSNREIALKVLDAAGPPPAPSDAGAYERAIRKVVAALRARTISADTRRLCILERDSLHRRAAELHAEIVQP